MKFKTIPVVIDAVKWTGLNVNELNEFMGFRPKVIDGRIRIQTPGGAIYASVGDYIIKGIKGEFYPCKPDMFKETYEEVNL